LRALAEPTSAGAMSWPL